MQRTEFLEDFIGYIQANFREHPNSAVAIRVIQCLVYIKKNIDYIAQQTGKQSILRHPTNHLAFHLDGYQDPDDTKDQLLKLIMEVESSVNAMLKIDPKQRHEVINGFLLNINESDVGCMNARLRPALMYLGYYFSTGVQHINEILFHFKSQADDIYSINSVLKFFSEKVDHHLLIMQTNGKIVPIDWKIIKDYLTNTLGWSDIEKDWEEYEKQLPKPLIEFRQGRRNPWYIYYFNNSADAQLYLNFIRSVLPENEQKNIKKANINNAHDNHGQYVFRLTPEQHKAFQLWRDAVSIKKEGKKVNVTTSPVNSSSFYIKTIRADEWNFFYDFSEMVTRSIPAK